MRQSVTLFTLLLTTIVTLACGSDNEPTTPTEASPVAVTESFSGTLTVNGLQVHPYTVGRAGITSAQIKSMSDAAATVALSLGTWNGIACSIVIANPAAVVNTTVTGSAQNTGQFCVMLNDVGKLRTGVDYSLDVTHY
jgi:hypothetical protein